MPRRAGRRSFSCRSASGNGWPTRVFRTRGNWTGATNARGRPRLLVRAEPALVGSQVHRPRRDTVGRMGRQDAAGRGASVFVLLRRRHGILEGLQGHRRGVRRLRPRAHSDRCLCAALVHARTARRSPGSRANLQRPSCEEGDRHSLGHLRTRRRSVDEPPRLLAEAVAKAGLSSDAFTVLRHGQTIRLDDASPSRDARSP